MIRVSNIDNRQSVVITAMRFPLIILVLFQHSVGYDSSPMRWSWDGENVYHFLTEMISHHICSIAVPCFFLLSGFLFFYNLKESEKDYSWIKSKWKRRCRTLLIPFLFWNLAHVVAILLVTKAFGIVGLPIVSDQMPAVQKGPLYWFVTGPIDFPLWYLRDLIVLSMLAPFLYFFIRRFSRLFVGMLFLLYVVSADHNYYPSLTFFGMGCYLALQQKNLLTVCRQVRYPTAWLALAALLTATALYGRPIHPYLWLLFAPFGMITFVNLCDGLLRFPKVGSWMFKLSETVFFIYAAHEIYILGWTKGLLLRIFGDTLTGHWICYLAAPVLTLTIGLALYYILKKIMPKSLAFACGGRINTRL